MLQWLAQFLTAPIINGFLDAYIASFHMANGRGRACVTFVSSVAIAVSSIGSISGSRMAASNFERAATTAPPPPPAAASNSRRTNDGRFSHARPAAP